MAFTFEVIRGSSVYDFSAGQVIALADADDLGGASVRNLEEQGPYQDGSSHLGERLEARTMTLRFNVVGATAAALDGHRDTLNAAFKPVRGVPIIVKVTRDDGEIRQIDCRRAGPLSIPLKKEDYPGHLHRAVVQLRAADPTFYDPVEQTETFDGPSILWWTGFGVIGTANVIEHVENPTQGQLWTNPAAVAAGSAWSIFFKSGSVVYNEILPEYAFGLSPSAGGPEFETTSGGHYTEAGTAHFMGPAAFMSAGTATYLLSTNGGTARLYRDMVEIASDTTGGITAAIPAASPGTARWRSDRSNNASSRWPVALPYAAAYNIELDATQRAALQAATSSGSAYSLPVAYEGDWDSYPVIEIHGPVTSPVITNTATGDTLDFTGGTVGSADVWTIDTRYGRKGALNSAGSSVANYLSLGSDLATFRLVPDPTATGGTNVITVAGSVVGTATTVEMSWFSRYLSF